MPLITTTKDKTLGFLRHLGDYPKEFVRGFTHGIIPQPEPKGKFSQKVEGLRASGYSDEEIKEGIKIYIRGCIERGMLEEAKEAQGYLRYIDKPTAEKIGELAGLFAAYGVPLGRGSKLIAGAAETAPGLIRSLLKSPTVRESIIGTIGVPAITTVRELIGKGKVPPARQLAEEAVGAGVLGPIGFRVGRRYLPKLFGAPEGKPVGVGEKLVDDLERIAAKPVEEITPEEVKTLSQAIEDHQTGKINLPEEVGLRVSETLSNLIKRREPPLSPAPLPIPKTTAKPAVEEIFEPARSAREIDTIASKPLAKITRAEANKMYSAIIEGTLPKKVYKKAFNKLTKWATLQQKRPSPGIFPPYYKGKGPVEAPPIKKSQGKEPTKTPPKKSQGSSPLPPLALLSIPITPETGLIPPSLETLTPEEYEEAERELGILGA
ncbi:MAG: hypothetical protein ACUVWN_04665 [bacterium]